MPTPCSTPRWFISHDEAAAAFARRRILGIQATVNFFSAAPGIVLGPPHCSLGRSANEAAMLFWLIASPDQAASQINEQKADQATSPLLGCKADQASEAPCGPCKKKAKQARSTLLAERPSRSMEMLWLSLWVSVNYKKLV
jgi:hypothetical protein